MLRKVIQRAVFTTIALVGIININNSIYISGSASASTSDLTMSATINPSSTVEISANSVALNVVPSAAGTFKASTPLTVNAYTNSNYDCTITMETSSTSLTSGGNSIATLDNTYTESTFVNDKWGFSTDATNYGPVALTNSVGTFSSTTPNAASITFAAKLTQATKPGTYTNTVTFASTCTPPPLYMQDATKAELAFRMPNVGNSITIYDSRDEQGYTVTKLADGKYWMTKNLNLAGGTALSSTDTDFDSSYPLPTTDGWTVANNKLILPASDNSSTSFSTNNVAYVYNSGGETCGNNSPCYSYYSWDAATLGSGRSISTDNTNAPYSICPKGWRLPTTYNGSGSAAEATDFRALMIALGGSNSIQTYDNSTTPTGATLYGLIGPGSTPNFSRSGYYGDGSFGYAGPTSGFYWSATSYPSTNIARLLYFYSGYINTAGIDDRRLGKAIRCVFGPQS